MTQTILNPLTKLLALTSLLGLVMLSGGGCSDSGTGLDDGNGTGIDSISFSGVVQPILNANCTGSSCHIPGPEPSTNRSLKDYESVMGKALGRFIVVRGNSEESMIIKRLEGTIQPQMPFGRTPLTTAQIALIKKWIDQGANDN